MIRRFLTAVALLLAGLSSSAVAGPPESSCEAATQALVPRVYPVADLVIPMDGLPNPLKVCSADAAGEECCEAGCPSAENGKSLHDQLLQLITSKVAPHTWCDRGGLGTVGYFPLGMCLVVRQSEEVHEQISKLLADLRREQEVQVTVEVRILSLADSSLERIGVDFDLDVEGNEDGTLGCQLRAKDGSADLAAIKEAILASYSGKTTVLNDVQVFQLVEAAQGDVRTNVLQAPKLTLFNGQRAAVDATEKQFYVTDVEQLEHEGQILFVPKNEVVATGFRMSVRPLVSPDRRHVSLHAKVSQTDLATPTIPLFPIEYSLKPVGKAGKPGKPVRFTQYIQQPRFETLAADRTVKIPDGGTVVLANWKRSREVRQEHGVPVLSKVPYLNRLFKKVSCGTEVENVIVLVTPRIIVPEEEEVRTTDTVTCPHLRQQIVERAAPAVADPLADRTVLDNLRHLEQARKHYARAEEYREAGKPELARRAYGKVQEVCPGCSYARMAVERQADLVVPVVVPAVAAATSGAEEQEPAASSGQQKKLGKLLERYEAACAAGRVDEAKHLATKALRLDPTCFSKHSARSDK